LDSDNIIELDSNNDGVGDILDNNNSIIELMDSDDEVQSIMKPRQRNWLLREKLELLDIFKAQFSVYVWLLLIISRGGVTILARLRFFGGGKQSLGEAVRQIPLYVVYCCVPVVFVVVIPLLK
jgi:hypothetical protein